MLLRNVGVVSFIGICAAAGIYFGQRDTVARGDVMAADLVATNPLVKSLDCDKDIPIGLAGASFQCHAEFKNGDQQSFRFAMDRAGAITVVDAGEKTSVPRIKKTSDPWGD